MNKIQKAITANSGEYIYLTLRPAGDVLDIIKHYISGVDKKIKKIRGKK